jgi:molybdopterin-guanine dinucleotide biosynthesis protein A
MPEIAAPVVAAAILAGGRARRMNGVNKAQLRIGGERIVERQLRLLRAVADPVFIVSSRQEEFADLGVEVVPDAIAGAGPLGGIYTALVTSPRARTLIVGCDLPFLAPALLERLTAPSAADLVIPRSVRGYEPLCATWSAGCAESLRRRIETGALKAALAVEDLRVEEIGADVVASCDPHGLLFVNINTPHDYERAQRLGQVESKSLRDRIMDVSETVDRPE